GVQADGLDREGRVAEVVVRVDAHAVLVAAPLRVAGDRRVAPLAPGAPAAAGAALHVGAAARALGVARPAVELEGARPAGPAVVRDVEPGDRGIAADRREQARAARVDVGVERQQEARGERADDGGVLDRHGDRRARAGREDLVRRRLEAVLGV